MRWIWSQCRCQVNCTTSWYWCSLTHQFLMHQVWYSNSPAKHLPDKGQLLSQQISWHYSFTKARKELALLYTHIFVLCIAVFTPKNPSDDKICHTSYSWWWDIYLPILDNKACILWCVIRSAVEWFASHAKWQHLQLLFCSVLSAPNRANTK